MLSLAFLGRAQPVVATLVSISERAVDDNGNGLPDRLEITALLNVVKPGKYEIRFLISGPGGEALMGTGEGTLAAGRQQLKASVPAERLRDALRDGPFIINNVQVYRPVGNTFGDFVAGSVQPLKTAAYQRAGWDRGPVYGEEEVRLRPIRAAKSGKFRALEVVWEAVTTGGSCSWTGDLSVGNDSIHLIQSGDLRPGRSRFVFEFEMGGLARATGNESSFHGIVNCEDGSEGAASALVRLRVVPREFEPWESSLSVISQWMMRATVGGGSDGATAQLETRGGGPGPVQYRLKSVPKGLTTHLLGADLQVAAGAQMTPGRYYIEVEAVSGSVSGAGMVVVDVVTAVPPKPEGKHSAGVATARGVRPDAQGRFQTLEVLWPVEVPGGDCGWEGVLTSEGAATGNVLSNAYLPKGKSLLSMAFPGSIAGNSGRGSWQFRGHIQCGNHPQGLGVTAVTKLVLQPEAFAKRPGLPLRSAMVARVGSGGFGMAELTLQSSATATPEFKVLSTPKGIVLKNARPSRFREYYSLWMEVWADEGVAEGRYYLPAMVTLGNQTGTAEVVVDVVRE
jgi:hypothetical protein